MISGAWRSSTLSTRQASPRNGEEGRFSDEQVFPERTKAGFLDRIAVALAGLAAEERLGSVRGLLEEGEGKVPTFTSPRRSPCRWKLLMGWGAGFTVLSGASEEELLVTLHMNGGLQAQVENVLAAEFRRAKKLAEEKRTELERIAESLLRKKTLSAEDVLYLISLQPRFCLDPPH
ncbi:hypothetical protein [Mesorhizobium sp. Root102]|uniref:hypothetical protein n=1 Tax=Mesorhizobium sp. Root102 TaxID=1736422 RepID=UPI00138F394F|nr:hypothetical protein [Mesorhizobium sp. Root102]